MKSTREQIQQYCLFGAPLDTGNLGVTALSVSVMDGIAQRCPDWQPVIFDYGRNVRRTTFRTGGSATLNVLQIGSSNSRRVYRPDTLGFMRLAQSVGGLRSTGLQAMRSCRAVLDVSGGDSFTDLYGSRRFADMITRKRLALHAGAKLILLPQTYGPFADRRKREIARGLVLRARAAWARDPDSLDSLQDLLGADFSADRHRSGVDLAFGLPLVKPAPEFADYVEQWTSIPGCETVGVNVSGLIYNGGTEAQRQYGLKADYRELTHSLVRRLLAEGNCRIVLVPHVFRDQNDTREDTESDLVACERVRAELHDESDGRLDVLPLLFDPREIKWAIGQFDWFCGTRMHSTIAALSTGVPTSAVAYSLKTRGVFETCDAADCVADPRCLDTEQSLEVLWESFVHREEHRARLLRRLPAVTSQCQRQMDEIVAVASE